MKTNELTGAALNWAVAKCEGHDAHFYGGIVRTTMRGVFGPECHYSTDWAQGGPIIEAWGMCISRTNKTREEPWAAYLDGYYWIDGPTPLIAAMRCYVASKFGDNVDIPKELTE